MVPSVETDPLFRDREFPSSLRAAAGRSTPPGSEDASYRASEQREGRVFDLTQ